MSASSAAVSRLVVVVAMGAFVANLPPVDADDRERPAARVGGLDRSGRDLLRAHAAKHTYARMAVSEMKNLPTFEAYLAGLGLFPPAAFLSEARGRVAELIAIRQREKESHQAVRDRAKQRGMVARLYGDIAKGGGAARAALVQLIAADPRNASAYVETLSHYSAEHAQAESYKHVSSMESLRRDTAQNIKEAQLLQIYREALRRGESRPAQQQAPEAVTGTSEGDLGTGQPGVRLASRRQ